MLGNRLYINIDITGMDYDALSFVLSGRLRQEMVKALKEPKTPAQLTKELQTQDSSISRTLRELEEKKIIECLFPERKKGRIYRLTEKGKQISGKL
jgi:ArsR family transcriptional regulator, cadmium/lead-responsive transcriptional repressor